MFFSEKLKSAAIALCFLAPFNLSSSTAIMRDVLHSQMSNPLEASLVGILRDNTTSCKDFQQATKQLAHFLVFKTAQYLATDTKSIQTPVAPFTSTIIKKNPILVPILRSGLALLSEFQDHFKGATVGFLGFKRDEKTAIASLYYSNLPSIKNDDRVVVLEPMLATGGTLVQAVSLLKSAGAAEENIIIATVISAPEGVMRLQQEYPGVKIITCALDECLNGHRYIVPGLGDFGDRYFGTTDSE